MRVSRKTALALFSAGILAAAICAWAIYMFFNPGLGTVPMTNAPSATSTPRPAPSVATPSPSASPSPTPVDTPPSMADIDGVPMHVEITRGSTVLVNTDVVPIGLEDDGRLVPPAGKAGVYYSQDWHALPGNLSTHRGIIAGHNVDGYGTPDVFLPLRDVKKGDVVTLTYRLNGSNELPTATFEVLADALSASKDEVVTGERFRYIWAAASEPGRFLTLLTCDLDYAAPGEHSSHNWVVDAVRTK